MPDGREPSPHAPHHLRDRSDERAGRILLALAFAVALAAALRDFFAPWDGGFRGAMTALYEDVFVRNHLTHGLSATHWSPAYVVDVENGAGTWHWHHPPYYPLWLTAFAAVLGHHEWVLRLSHFVLYLPGIAALWWLVREVSNARLAGWAALLFTATPLVGYFGPMVCYDGALMSLSIATVAAFWHWAQTATKRGWWLPATLFFATASIDFLGQFCGLALFALAWFTPHPRRAAIGVLAMLPLSILSVAIIALIYGTFLGGPLGFLREMLHFSAYEQSRAGEVTPEAIERAANDVLVVFGTWPLLALAAAGLLGVLLEGDLRKKTLFAIVIALLLTPLLGSLVTLKHFVDHPFWPMPLMAGLAVLAAIVPALGHRWFLEQDPSRQLVGAMFAILGAAAVVHGAYTAQERITFFQRNDPEFPRLLQDVGERIAGSMAGFTNRTVIARRYDPGVIFQGDIDEAWEVDFVLAYGKQSGFRGDAAFVIDRTIAKPELIARLDQLAKAESLGRATLYRFRAW